MGPHQHLVSLREWLAPDGAHGADGGFARCVDLSLALSRHLRDLLAAGAISLSEIATENVLVVAEAENDALDAYLATSAGNSSGPSARQAVRSVQFQLDAPGINGPPASMASRAVCNALGRILLDIFSAGGSSSRFDDGRGRLVSHSDISRAPSITTECTAASHPGSCKRRVSRDQCSSDGSSRPASPSADAEQCLLARGVPLSIRRLVCDLLSTNGGRTTDRGSMNHACRGAPATLDEAIDDLKNMKDDPRSFLYDRTDPQMALEDTGLFGGARGGAPGRLFGREEELRLLTEKKDTFANHVLRDEFEPMDVVNDGFDRSVDFRCEAVFLSGYSGSGKSTLMQSLVRSCIDDGWFVLRLKYDTSLSPFEVLARAFEEFFAAWLASDSVGSNLAPSFRRACRCIVSTYDEEGLRQLGEMIPSLSEVHRRFSTMTSSRTGNRDRGTSSSMDRVGSATNRRANLYHVLFKALSSSGRPFLVALDDLQWGNALVGLKALLADYVNIPSVVGDGAPRHHHGMMVVGTYRSNEVREDDGLLQTIDALERECNCAAVTKLAIGALRRDDIAEFLAASLRLPARYTRKLAELVLAKTRGNPLFVNQFLKTIVQNRMVEFSIKHRCWTWDQDVIDMQMISDDVAELLAASFDRLPDHLALTLKVISCIGSQVDEHTIDALNSDQEIVPNMLDEVKRAVEEGILESAGPVHQFTHDVVKSTVYESIPVDTRRELHKTIGDILLKSAGDDHTMHLLAVDQLNLSYDGVLPAQQERSHFAKINAKAARFSISASNFEQARSYIDVGMKMLDRTNRWADEQYPMSLELYEMSSSISCIKGDTLTGMAHLTELIANVKSFDDSLNASSLLSKLLASSNKYGEAIENCLSILDTLGEAFPKELSLSLVQYELSMAQMMLATVSIDQVKSLPAMTDRSKLNAMKFMSLLCSYCMIAKPMLLPFLCCRMVRLTIQHGFCDDSIVGLVTAAFSLFSFADETELSYRIGKIGEKLMEESKNRHALRSRLCLELEGTLKIMVEPVQSTAPLFPGLYNSAMLSGNVDVAMMCRRAYCNVIFYTGQSELGTCSKQMIDCVKQSAKHQQNLAQNCTVSTLRACTYLTGESHSEVEIMSYQDLRAIGEKSNNNLLLWQVFLDEMLSHFYRRDFRAVAELSQTRPHLQVKRVTEVCRTYFEGIAALTLARQTREAKWRDMGEKAVDRMSKWAYTSSLWNFENQCKLMSAELHYLNGNLQDAELEYLASIKLAQERRFLHEEATALEQYGMFLVECGKNIKGMGQLSIALNKYNEWGAVVKANDLRDFIDLIDPNHHKSLRVL